MRLTQPTAPFLRRRGRARLKPRLQPRKTDPSIIAMVLGKSRNYTRIATFPEVDGQVSGAS